VHALHGESKFTNGILAKPHFGVGHA
jgi:hypothetical protein